MLRARIGLLSFFASVSAFGAIVNCGGDDAITPIAPGPDATTPEPDGCGADCVDANNGTDSTVNDTGTDTSVPVEASGDAGDASDGSDTSDAGPDAMDAGTDTAPPFIPCDDASPCALGSCCSGFCHDTAKDPQNCGACGNACSGAQFCNSVTCLDLVLDNFCDNAKATVVIDGVPVDDDAGARIAAGFGQCTPSITVHIVPQDDGGVLEAVTDRPITGVGNTFAAAGGPYEQHGIGYLDSQGITPVHVTSSDAGATLAFEMRDGGTIISSPFMSLTATHDYFTVMVTTEPVSGTLVLTAYGMLSPGTTAAGWYFQNHMVPGIVADGGIDAGYPNAWYVYEWTDATTDGPSADDTFTMLASGS